MNTLRTACLAATALLVGTLAACGGPTPAPAPLPDTQATVNAALAATGTAQAGAFQPTTEAAIQATVNAIMAAAGTIQDNTTQATVEAAVRATVAAAPTVVPVTVVVAPTEAPATTSPTPTATKAPAPARTRPTPTSAGPLEFSLEFGQSQPRKGDNKVQMTVIAHIRGGVPPYQIMEDQTVQASTPRVDGVEYVRDWHDCSPQEPHTISVLSADGQASTQSVMLPYMCE
jgi:hypothetical protein